MRGPQSDHATGLACLHEPPVPSHRLQGRSHLPDVSAQQDKIFFALWAAVRLPTNSLHRFFGRIGNAILIVIVLEIHHA
jgi:hypothetical protein